MELVAVAAAAGEAQGVTHMKEAEIHFSLAGDSFLLEGQSILQQQEYHSTAPQGGAPHMQAPAQGSQANTPPQD